MGSPQKKEKLSQIKLETQYVNNYLKMIGVHHFFISRYEGDETKDIEVNYANLNEPKRGLKNTLSEGEKTALAFAYFLSKIKAEVPEQDRKNTIIVIDDPISSLDENRLYSIAYLISSEFSDFNQLFLLSHNLPFLKHLNPLLKKSEGSQDKGTYQKFKNQYYLSEGKLFPLPETLGNFLTPYFFMLGQLKSYQNGELLTGPRFRTSYLQN
jgi:wobble nucleotide-excising tRNase